MVVFGGKIKDARTKKRLTQKQLADLVGSKHNSVSDWENDKNKPDPDTLELIMGVLEIEPNTLFGWDDKQQLKQDAENLANKIETNSKINEAIVNIENLSSENKELINGFIEMLIKKNPNKGGDNNAN